MPPSFSPSSFPKTSQTPTYSPTTKNSSSETKNHTGSATQGSEEFVADEPTFSSASSVLSSASQRSLKSPDTLHALNANKPSISPTSTIYIVLNKLTNEKVMIDRESGTILSDVLTIRKRFRRIISFNPKTLTDAKHEFFLSEVGYWISFNHKVFYIVSGTTSRLLIK